MNKIWNLNRLSMIAEKRFKDLILRIIRSAKWLIDILKLQKMQKNLFIIIKS